MRHAPAVLLAALSLLFVASRPAEELALERDILGYFRPTKPVPAVFGNVAELHLAGRGEYGWKASPPYYGMIKTTGRRAATYSLTQPVIDGLSIRFATEAVGGISYDFAGVLSRADFSAGGIPIGEVMLRGTMRKLKNGRQTGVAQLRFVFETGG